jgi:Flp pilus assembly protein CpaB
MNAVPQRSEEGRPISAAVATVEVTPLEGERLAIAASRGQLQLMLRGYGDPDSGATNRVAAGQLFGGWECGGRARRNSDSTVVRDLLLRNCRVDDKHSPPPAGRDTATVRIFRSPPSP